MAGHDYRQNWHCGTRWGRRIVSWASKHVSVQTNKYDHWIAYYAANTHLRNNSTLCFVNIAYVLHITHRILSLFDVRTFQGIWPGCPEDFSVAREHQRCQWRTISKLPQSTESTMYVGRPSRIAPQWLDCGFFFFSWQGSMAAGKMRQK